jgi:hypothetical protein
MATLKRNRPIRRKWSSSQGLADYRLEQRKLAVERDDGLCQICLRVHGRTRLAQACHHVFGRSRKVDWRENSASLMCVCDECHPPPISLNYKDKDEWIVLLLKEMNSEAAYPRT